MDSRVEQKKIHFFEHLSIERFSNYLRSAFQYTTNILFDRWPFLVNFRYYQSEILFILEALLQSHFLYKFNSTYAEYFYGYSRKDVNDNVSPHKKKWVLLLSTFLPYLKRKFEKCYNDINMENESNTFQRKRLRNTIFILLFKLTHVISELTNFFFNLKYLLNPDTHYYSLQFYFMGQKLEKITESSIANSHFLINFFKKYFVFVLFLGTKFLDWYFQPANSNGQSNNTDNKIVGEPFKGMRNPTNFNYCSLCNKDFRNPTCLAVSGYVFCYTCIEEYVKRNGKCPITFVNCTLQSLHKIYKN